ncbi:MAG: hypothetical protein L0Y79_05980 [Chlorobi bacterium]|nr:hypothetical protein [Chlorobiota bacterium]MCI0714939.1 hypothetical protein [Chlorobiota bacterium]
MKLILSILFVIVISPYLISDQLYLLSKEDATSAADYLRTQEYVLLFCACCEYDSVTIIKIDEVLRVPDKEKEGYYYIKIGGDLVASFNFNKLTLNFEKPNLLKGKFYDKVDLMAVHAYWSKANNIESQLTATNTARVIEKYGNPCVDYFRFPKYSEMPEEIKVGDFTSWVMDMLKK